MHQLDEFRKFRMLVEAADKMAEKPCKHTSAWHKEDKKCSICGEKSKLHHEDKLDEAWGTKMHTAAKDKGMFKGRTLASLKTELKKLKANPKKTEALKKKEKQVEFAIRAKQKDKFGKIKESVGNVLTLKKLKNPQECGICFDENGIYGSPKLDFAVCKDCVEDLRDQFDSIVLPNVKKVEFDHKDKDFLKSMGIKESKDCCSCKNCSCDCHK
jgi:hypothetical protein